MRSDLVVLPEPNIDSDLGLYGGVEAELNECDRCSN